MVQYLDETWEKEDWPSLPGPAYERRYGVGSWGPEAMGETPEAWAERMERNEERYRRDQQPK